MRYWRLSNNSGSTGVGVRARVGGGVGGALVARPSRGLNVTISGVGTIHAGSTSQRSAKTMLLRVGDEDDLVAPVLFGAVHRIVGPGDQVIRVLIRDGHGDPDAQR